MDKWRLNSIFAVCLLTAFCLAVLCLAACSGKPKASPAGQTGSTDSGITVNAPAPAQVSSAVPDNAAATIVAFGDSLTAGVSGRSYPDQLQDLLTANHYSYRVENQGVSGDTSTDGLARIDNVIAIDPALVLLEFGGNDGLRGVPVAETRKNLDAMITRLQQAKIPLVLLGITLPPNYGADYVKPFTELFPALARQHKIKLIPFLLLNVYQNSSLMQPDGIHPNEAGNKTVAQDVFYLIRPLLRLHP